MKRRFTNLEYLRALCCVAVVLAHAGLHFGNPIPLGEGRVTVFFLMSGFVLWRASSARETDPADFLWRRLARLLPTYWLVTTLVVAASWAGVGGKQPVLWEDFTRSLLLIPYGPPVHGQFFPALKPGWTLVYELYFCFMLAMTLRLKLKLRFTVLSLLLGSLWVAGQIIHPIAPVLAVLTGFPMLDLLAGILIARYLHMIVLPRTLSWVLVSIGVFASFALPLIEGHEAAATAPRTLIWAAMTLLGCLGLESDNHRPLPVISRLSEASYSIFIWHWPVMTLSVSMLSVLHWHVPAALGMVGTSLLSIGIGRVMYERIERPMTTWLLTGRGWAPPTIADIPRPQPVTARWGRAAVNPSAPGQ
jgi:exopolysaccharide production protein ExoZ